MTLRHISTCFEEKPVEFFMDRATVTHILLPLRRTLVLASLEEQGEAMSVIQQRKGCWLYFLIISLDPIKYHKPNLVLITDIHGDHMDINTLQELDLNNATIIAP